VLQRRLIAGLQLAYVDLHGAGVSNGSLSVAFPEHPGHCEELALAAELARRSGAPVTGNTAGASSEHSSLRIAYPLRLGEHAEGAMVIEVEAPLSRQAEIIQFLRWSEAWLNLALAQGDAEPGYKGSGELIAEGFAQPDLASSQTAVLMKACAQLGCIRIALGEGRRGHARLLAVSDIVDLDRRGSRAKAVERAMQETFDAGETCSWPQAGNARQQVSAQQDLAELGGLSAVCSVTVSEGVRHPRLFVFEFSAQQPWGEALSTHCEETARTAALVLELRAERDAPWRQRLRALLGDGIRGMTGSADRPRRVLAAVAVLIFGALALSEGEYRVTAPAAIEGVVQRAVVAPFDGYVQYASIRAGQEVRQGDLMASLEDRDLRNERSGLLAEQGELAEQHRQAVAVLDHAKSKVLEAQLARVSADLDLVGDKLARTQLRAPLDGLVISGDWSRSLGVPVSRGQLMFEIAPPGEYRVAIEVSDREISQIAVGQPGELILSALPRRPVRLSVTGVTTLAAEETKVPVFRVEAMLAEAAPDIRPGMEGTAKVTAGERQRWWIWTHALTDWLRLQLWRWLP
jgi:hypothetical protein